MLFLSALEWAWSNLERSRYSILVSSSASFTSSCLLQGWRPVTCCQGLLGVLAVYIGGALLFVLGVQMLMASFKQSEERFMSPAGPGLLLFAIGVSLDSFSVGLSLGIYGSHPLLTITLFGLFSMMLTWLGLLVGKQVQSWLGTYSEALGGIILIVFGLKLLLPI